MINVFLTEAGTTIASRDSIISANSVIKVYSKYTKNFKEARLASSLLIESSYKGIKLLGSYESLEAAQAALEAAQAALEAAF